MTGATPMSGNAVLLVIFGMVVLAIVIRWNS
jgi:hypothetical protein